MKNKDKCDLQLLSFPRHVGQWWSTTCIDVYLSLEGGYARYMALMCCFVIFWGILVDIALNIEKAKGTTYHCQYILLNMPWIYIYIAINIPFKHINMNQLHYTVTFPYNCDTSQLVVGVSLYGYNTLNMCFKHELRFIHIMALR